MPKAVHYKYQNNHPISQAPSVNDPLAFHQVSYLNGGGGSGKSFRAISLFKNIKPLILTLTHRLAKEFRERCVDSQTYHSFFRWSGQKEWDPQVMGQKFIPRNIIWDEICTVPMPILEIFLEWLKVRDVHLVLCGDPAQPPPITGDLPHDWLKTYVNYYEEVETDYRAKDDEINILKKECVYKQTKFNVKK